MTNRPDADEDAVSVVGRMFCGELCSDLVFPFPRMDDEGANDVLRMLVALRGCDGLGGELADVRDLDLREPLRSVGAVAGYLGGRLRRTVLPDGLAHAHHDFADRADQVSGQVVSLRNAAEKLLRRHGDRIGEQQAQLKRVAEAATEIYAQVATIARIADVLDNTSPSEAFGDEQEIAHAFCQRSSDRAGRWLAHVGDNDDDDIDTIASHVIERTRYIHTV